MWWTRVRARPARRSAPQLWMTTMSASTTAKRYVWPSDGFLRYGIWMALIDGFGIGSPHDEDAGCFPEGRGCTPPRECAQGRADSESRLAWKGRRGYCRAKPTVKAGFEPILGRSGSFYVYGLCFCPGTSSGCLSLYRNAQFVGLEALCLKWYSSST